MARTASMMLSLGTTAPAFKLQDHEGRTVSLEDFRGAPALLVAFICNHCPYVLHVAPGFAQLAADYQARGVAFVAISSNDVSEYPDDSPEKMREFAAQHGFKFPYLYDPTQQVAKDYQAACTPDFYLFDGERRLAYRGQLDGSRPGSNIPVTGADLRRALDAVLEGRPVDPVQRPSIGCNIKWQAGNEPEYFGMTLAPKA